MDANWVLLASVALLVRAGQMLAAMGISRAKNVASAGVRSLVDVCVATLAFWALGCAIASHQANPIFGIQADLLIGWAGLPVHFFRLLAIALIATGVVAPAVAERSKLRVTIAFAAVIAGLILPIIIHWVQWGWLLVHGFIDDGGATAVHLAPAICAAIAILFVGPREGKYNRDGSSNMIPGHSVPMILLSMILMFIGWAAYISCFSLENGIRMNQIAANVFVAAAAGAVVAMILGHIRFGKIDVLLTCSGLLGALVSITAGAAHVSTPAAFAIGAIAGWLIPFATVMIDLRLKLDDPGGVVAIHGVGALWSLIAVAIFLPTDYPDNRFKVLGIQLVGIVVIFVTTAAIALLAATFLRMAGSIRSKEADEYDGLDLADHDINAHPDFQQTMIKSYHLREA